MKKVRSIYPVTILFIGCVLLELVHQLLPLSQVITYPLNLSGLFLIIGGIVINLWADNLFKKSKTTVKPFLKSTTLVTGGPYRFSRHPMYLGFVCLLLGLAIILGSLGPLIIVFIFYLLLQRQFVIPEEQKMEKTFGQFYRDYQQRTRQWL